MANGNGEKRPGIGIISPQTLVPLSFVVGAIVSVSGGIIGWRDAAHERALLKSELTQLREQIKTLDTRIVGKTPEGWHRIDMELWTERTRSMNPEWRPAPVRP